jgi:hypothetical protein
MVCLSLGIWSQQKEIEPEGERDFVVDYENTYHSEEKREIYGSRRSLARQQRTNINKSVDMATPKRM